MAWILCDLPSVATKMLKSAFMCVWHTHSPGLTWLLSPCGVPASLPTDPIASRGGRVSCSTQPDLGEWGTQGLKKIYYQQRPPILGHLMATQPRGGASVKELHPTLLTTQAGVNGEAGFGSLCQGSGLGFDPWSVSQHFSSVAVSSVHEHLT